MEDQVQERFLSREVTAALQGSAEHVGVAGPAETILGEEIQEIIKLPTTINQRVTTKLQMLKRIKLKSEEFQLIWSAHRSGFIVCCGQIYSQICLDLVGKILAKKLTVSLLLLLLTMEPGVSGICLRLFMFAFLSLYCPP